MRQSLGSQDNTVPVGASDPSLLPVVGAMEKISQVMKRWFYSRGTQLFLDGITVIVALAVSYFNRFDGSLPQEYHTQLYLLAPVAVVLYLGTNLALGVYRQVWRFVSFSDAVRILQSIAFATLLLVIVSAGLQRGMPDPQRLDVPSGVLLTFPFFVFGAWITLRVFRRIEYGKHRLRRIMANSASPRKRLLIVGAGAAGVALVRELANRSEFEIAGFIDDDPRLQRRKIEGYQVLGSTEEIHDIIEKHRVDEVTLCIPSAPRWVLESIVRKCQTTGVKISTVPSLGEIVLGKVTISRLRPVEMESLLGRSCIAYPAEDPHLMETYRGQRILVTGAGGSIGSELVRQLRQFSPSFLILLDKDENSLFETCMEIREDFDPVIEVVADVRDRDRIFQVFEKLRPTVVFHAAAYKHVPLMEIHPSEAIFNNVTGTRNLVEASQHFGVRTFVFISTDKAVNPTSVMGASKRVAEMVVQNAASSGTRTRFSCVRFGNVLGSRGSVIPIFQRQIKTGRPITVTHPEVRRFFMTISEAVQLVIQAGSLGERGEIFLLDMGEPIKIVDLARNLIEQSGLIPGKDVDVQFTGLRPGEKLYEELLVNGENGIRSTRYPKIFMAQALSLDQESVQRAVAELEVGARNQDGEAIRAIFQRLDIGYQVLKVPSMATERGSSLVYQT